VKPKLAEMTQAMIGIPRGPKTYVPFKDRAKMGPAEPKNPWLSDSRRKTSRAKVTLPKINIP
jgi:hypothetical protein